MPANAESLAEGECLAAGEPLAKGKHLANAAHRVRWLRYAFMVLGGCIIAAALVTYFFRIDLVSFFSWLEKAFGPSFSVLFAGLLGLGVVSIVKISRSRRPALWLEVGQQAASGMATLALTFTLLGISLGIDSLSHEPLSPETIGSVIQTLTAHFSVAFMTTVVGLPTAHIIRSVLSVRWVALNPPGPMPFTS